MFVGDNFNFFGLRRSLTLINSQRKVNENWADGHKNLIKKKVT